MSDDYKYKNIYKSTLTEVKDVAGKTLRDAYKKVRGLVESPPERSFSVFDAEEKLKKREKKIHDEIGD